MLDFKKLMDPAEQAKARAAREEDERVQEAKNEEIRAMIDKVMDHHDYLPERERSFIRSCRQRVSTWSYLSDAQEKWLRDIAARLPS